MSAAPNHKIPLAQRLYAAFAAWQDRRFGGEAVFHRAFDCTPGPLEAIQNLIDLGFDRVLTSGQAATAPEGAGLLKKLQERYGDKIEILAGCGVSPANAGDLMAATGVSQLHSSWASASIWAADSAFSADRMRTLFSVI